MGGFAILKDNMQKINVNMVSESEFGVKGHGVHTAYVEMHRALQGRQEINVGVNHFFKKVDVTHIQTMWPYAFSSLMFGSGKKVVSAHIVPDSLLGSFKGANRLHKASTKYLSYFYRQADIVLAVSSTVKEVLVDELGVDPRKVHVLYNTIDMKQYHTTPAQKAKMRKQLKISPSKFVVVGNGQIQPRKRFDIFVQLAKNMPDVDFIWIGGIPFKHLGAAHTQMQELVMQAPANLQVTGVIPLRDVKQYFQVADVFLLPAEQENHPMAVLEAAGVGLPLVVRDIPEYNDTFGQDIVRVKDEAFQKVLESLQTDKTFYAHAVKGAQAIAKRFDSKEGARQLADYYQQVLG